MPMQITLTQSFMIKPQS